MRDYKLVLQQFMDAYGLEKSTVSERFVQASRKKLEALMSRSLQHLQLCAVLVDGTIFKNQHLVVAIGVDAFGNKMVLGLVQGATENAKVVGGLFDHLAGRGLDFGQPRLYLIDGSRALRAAIERHAGEAAFIQRCQVHNIRNILAYVLETHQHWFKYKLRLAYAHAYSSDARQALYRLHDELNELTRVRPPAQWRGWRKPSRSMICRCMPGCAALLVARMAPNPAFRWSKLSAPVSNAGRVGITACAGWASALLCRNTLESPSRLPSFAAAYS